MTLGSGLFRNVIWGKETTWGTEALTNSGTVLPRVSSTLSPTKPFFQSNQIRADQQVVDARGGVTGVSGQINGELQPKTFEPFIASLIRATPTTGISKTNTDFSGTLSASNTGTFTVSAGSFITQGFRVGDTFRVVGTPQNTGQNFTIIGLTATVATVYPNPTTMTAQAAFTLTVVGKKSATSPTTTIDDSYTFEHFNADIAQSEQFLGCKIANASVSLPATALATINMGIQGKSRVTGTSQYFTTPAANGDFGLTAGVNGVLAINGAQSAIVTGVNFQIDGGLQPTAAVGSSTPPSIAVGIIRASGSFSAYFQDQVIDTLFTNETAVSLTVMLTVGSAANADFVSFTFPKIKLSTSQVNDAPGPLMKSFNFIALRDVSTTSVDSSTVVYQDSQG